ncbi:uncharacterized protein KIAA1671 homolog isoform X2 [Elgaria multicarinata webbii]|uniref:uncharacterized protein KIAA1671 homolog isoform X2 n=1 Tax=Elgaria multicarinata webbii TaxID=159646 RepID=UPI002FCD39F6
MRAMATQVEVSSALTSLNNIAELKNEATLQHAFVSSLSDTSNKGSEHPSSLSPLILEGRSKFGSPVRPATMPPAASRPRLTPKPFSREMSSDTFTMVKPPVPALKPSNAAPKPSTFAKTFGDTTTAKGLTGNVPPLVDHKLIENKSTRELVANMPFYSSPLANTVILFKTGSAEKARMNLTPEKTFSTLQDPEGQLPPSMSEISYRRSESAGIHRQSSLSSESRPVSWNLRRSHERKDTFSGATEERAKDVEKEPSNSSISLVSEVQPRPKQRPVSAIFLESLKDPKQCSPDIADEKSTLEKSWVRKPRPLSMDLTAKFESRDLSVQRRSCPAEGKERNLVAHFVDVGSSRPSEIGAKSEAAGLSPADTSKSNLKSAVPVADFQCAKSKSAAQIQKPSPSEVAPLCWNAPKDVGQASAKDRKYLWELRLKSQDEQNEGETDIAAISEKIKEPSNSKGQSVKERTVLNQKDTPAVSENSTNAENKSLRGGSVKIPVNFQDALANGTTPGNAESLPESPGKEKRILNIQQRIKELTAENTDTKPVNQRRSFRSRPLSADLTKLFSSPMTAGEMKPERQLEVNRESLSETPDIQENETQPLRGTDSKETHVAGTPWKPQQLIKTAQTAGHLERDGNLVRERQNVTLQGESPARVASHDTRAHSIPPPPPAENAASIKTVRATMFEHNVQRHHVAADHFGAEPALQPMKELVGRQLGHGKESWMERELEAKTLPKKALSRQTSLDAEKHWKTESLNEVKALQATTWGKYTAKEMYEKPTPKHVEDSLVYQRIEPRYEILQTVGERVQSEAVTAVPEDKAVTLRSRRSLKERRKMDGSATDAVWRRSLDVKGDSWKEDGLISKPKATEEAASKTSPLRELNVSQSYHAFHEHVNELNRNRTGQQHAAVKPLYFTNRNKDLGTADDKAAKLTPEVDEEKGGAVLAGKLESSKLLKRFSENFGAGPGRTEDCEARVNVGQNSVSSVTSEHESQPSLYGVSQWHKFSRRASHLSTDPKPTSEQETSKVFGLKTWPSAYGVQEELNVSDRRAGGERFQQLDAEEKVRRNGRHVSTTKASERWRRKTLPHDAARFEEVRELAQENAKSLSRRDSLQLCDGSVAKRSPVARDGAEPRDGSFRGTPGSPDDSLKNQLSPSEAKATYFAVTYQISDENENTSGNVFEPLKSRYVSSLAEDVSVTSRKSHPSSRQPTQSFSDTQGSLDRHLSKNGRGGDASDSPKQGAFKYPLSEVRDANWRSLERRRVAEANERFKDLNPPLHSELKSPPSFRRIPQDGERIGQKKHSDRSHGMATEKAADNYRSRVLDIDVLMAEYGEDSKKASAIQDKRGGRLPEDSSLASWEKLASKRTSTDKTSYGYNQRDPKRLDHSPGGSRRSFYATENVCVGEREKSESCSQEPSPLKARDVNFSPPNWGRLAAEQTKYLPADPASNRKKTFIIDEGEGESLVLRHQTEKYANYNTQVSGPVCMAVEPEASVAAAAPLPSHPQLHADGALWKGESPKQQAAASSDDDGCTDVNRSGVKKRKSGANGSSLEKESSAIESGAKWTSSVTPSLLNALPDLRRSYSEKSRQARPRGNLPSGPGAKERQDQNRVRQSFPPESAESRLNKWTASQHDSFLQEGKKDPEKERTEPDRDVSAARNPPHLPIQRRSRSFYKDKRVDHWTMDQLKQCFGRPAAEAKDTDTLVHEADSQYGTWSDQRHSGDSFAPESPSSESHAAPTRRQPSGSRLSSFSSQTDPASTTDQQDSSRDHRSASLDRSSTDVDSADSVPTPVGPSVDFSFLDQTPVLDSSVLKTRVQLSKRRRQHRAPISHSLRRSTGPDDEQQLSRTEEVDGAWMFQDATEGEKSSKREDSDEEEKPQPRERSPASQPQRRPVFPGMDHSALKAQLRKRHEPEGAGEGHPMQLPRSPKSPFQSGGVSGGRVLPAGTEKEERSEEQSPQWLKELKSKKRQSQYENQV